MASEDAVNGERATQHEFYAGAASGASRKMLAEAQRIFDGARPSRIMINYQTQLNDRDARWRNYQLFVDPGAYSMFAPKPIGQGLYDYPESTESYIHDIGRQQPDRYAWRDYVCEGDVRELHDVTVEDQQERTTERHIECANLHEDYGISADPVAVVQGFEPDDYRRHAQDLVDNDLVTERVGIGTMCGRDNTQVCEDIIQAVREVLPDVELHAFGLDRRCYGSDYIIEEITSTDSLAYCYRYHRPSGWARWEYVMKMYLNHKSDWDDAIGGAEHQKRDAPGRAQQTLAVAGGIELEGDR